MAIQLPVFNPNIVSFGFIEIKYYSLAYIFGILICWYLTKKLNNMQNKKVFDIENKQFCDDFFYYAVLGIILGGRIGYVFLYNFNYYIHNILDILKIWQGGMSFHGAFIGCLTSGYLLCKKYKIDFLKASDIIVFSIPIALFLGRIANFINLELYGRPTNAPWAMIFPYSDGLPRHPSQLYEALCEGILTFLILIFITKKYKFKYKGLNTGIFFICYGIFRFIIEFFREPDQQIGYILNYFTMGQILSIPLFIAGCYILSKSIYKKQNL